MKIDSDSAQVTFPPPLVYLGALLLGLAVGAGLGRPGIPLPRGLTYPGGIVLLVAGLAVLLTALGLFRKAGTAPEPWRASSAVVTGGVYRWTRNPMYLGMAATYAGIALVANSLVALVLLAPVLWVIQTRVIAREERYMEARFGEPYRTYKARVRRWL